MIWDNSIILKSQFSNILHGVSFLISLLNQIKHMVLHRIIRHLEDLIPLASEKFHIALHSLCWLDPNSVEDRNEEHEKYRDHNFKHFNCQQFYKLAKFNIKYLWQNAQIYILLVSKLSWYRTYKAPLSNFQYLIHNLFPIAWKATYWVEIEAIFFLLLWIEQLCCSVLFEINPQWVS